MSVMRYKQCVLFASVVYLFIISCNNANMTMEEKDLKKDTMARNTDLQEPQLTKTINGPASKLFVTDGGAGDIAVVFVHSFSGSSRDWENQLEHLRPDRRAIAFDLRVHGQSGK